MLSTSNFTKKSLDEIEVYQHNYGQTDVNDVEAWLNVNGATGFTAEIYGVMDTLIVKKDDVTVAEVPYGNCLVRASDGGVHFVPWPLLNVLWAPATP